MVATLAGLFVVVLVRTAWLSDDAYITFRTIDNFVTGHGLRWNAAERVQTYTHPLWLMLVAVPYWVTRDAYFTPLLLQLALSVATIGLLISSLSASFTATCLGLTALIFSKAFMEYSTSGLENPLSHFLVALFLVSYWPPVGGAHFSARMSAPVARWLFAGLLLLNRLDAGLLVLPALLVRFDRRNWRPFARAAVIGLAPIMAWEIFSVVYYGFPFPNTAYAKLQTGVSPASSMGQGLLYFLDSLSQDPVTLLSIVGFVSLAVRHRARDGGPIAAGIALYLFYIIWIGGDFMSGRFLAAPLLCAVALMVRFPWPGLRAGAPMFAGVIVVLGFVATTRPPITSGAHTFILAGADGMGVGGVADERAFYYRYTGLLRWTRETPLPHNEEEDRGRRMRAAGPSVAVQGSIGLFGFFAGPDVHIVDPLGLGDPLLSRLPAEPGWRVGHYLRAVPDGYVETLETGHNVIVDSTIAATYERVKAVTRGPLWTRRRWREIWRLN